MAPKFICFGKEELIINVTDAYVDYIHLRPSNKSSDLHEYWKQTFKKIVRDKF